MIPWGELRRVYRHLQAEAKRARDARVARRLLALMWLAEGMSAREVAQRLGVGRWTVYRWVRWWQERQPEPLGARMRDRKRSGRPACLREAVAQRLPALLVQDPRTLGYRHTTWTVPLRARHLAAREGIHASEMTVRRVLHALGYRWKRPRFVRSRQAPHWRQAKGGCNAICIKTDGR